MADVESSREGLQSEGAPLKESELQRLQSEGAPSKESELQRLQRDVPQKEGEKQDSLQREGVAEEAGPEVEEENLQDFLQREQIPEVPVAERTWSPKIIVYIIVWILMVVIAIIGLVEVITKENKTSGIIILSSILAAIVALFIFMVSWKFWKSRARAVGQIAQ